MNQKHAIFSLIVTTLLFFCLTFMALYHHYIQAKTNNTSSRFLLQQRINSKINSVIEDDERPKVSTIDERKPTCDVLDDEGACVGENLGLPSGVVGDAESGTVNTSNVFPVKKNKILAKDVLLQKNQQNQQNQQIKAIAVNTNSINPMNRFMQQLYQPQLIQTQKSNYPKNIIQIPAPLPLITKPIRILPR